MHASLHHEPLMHASFRRRGDHDDCYRIWIDGPVVLIQGRGTWDLTVAEAYVADITRVVDELRMSRPQLRVIVDRSTVPIYGAGVLELLLTSYHTILRAGDRIAMVVESSLAKGQVRRIVGREETQSFLSISAARTWVLAYD